MRNIGQNEAAADELQAVWRLWQAVDRAKDERIAELEATCEGLRRRLARLTRIERASSRLAPHEAKARRAKPLPR